MAPKRKRHDEELLAQCVARVLAGETATAVSRDTDIPYTTLMNRVHWKKTGYEPAAKRRQQVQMAALLAPAGEGSPSDAASVAASASASASASATRQAAPPLAEVDEEILLVMARMQRAGVKVRRRDVLNKANEMKEPEAAECGIQWFQRFRDRHAEVSGPGTSLVLAESTVEQLLGSLEEEVETVGGREEQKKQKEQLTPSQRAVQELQSCYAEQLDAEDMVDAFDIMADPVMARVFLVIAPGQLRDLWLKRRIEKVRDDETSDADMIEHVASAT
ncbi:hypothetical protein PHYSODRAFT_315288 [Phytophthora sojae]|uniref:HTH CENPB-type domain-containing protein n=1 Tax=Phytophthora sojae (strain P6497) TaxID=1094619 RepID=G4ZH33_PHYSP|nr:hypothetical protein PHYSODRAFT_315288 [Phytophthora sojae]EGZ18658.1 hypothetical protein PHYSODRAFT_315288 [Phytophthora sojae]|eukprot:XP_009527716.1 hypothetical protein PHYSODRAFT_315288 [Phytophthora sojae]